MIFVYASMNARYWPCSFVNVAIARIKTPNGLPLTGGHRTPKRVALGVTALRWTSGAAAELAAGHLPVPISEVAHS